jgi:hypothetical protein
MRGPFARIEGCMLSEAEIQPTGLWSLRRRRVASVSVIALLSACAAACGSSRPQEPSGLVGAIRFQGGPPGAVIDQRQGGRVELVRAHKVVASMQVRPGQRFRLNAPPGAYELEGRSGDAMCRSKEVTVHAGATTQMDMTCDVR